MTPPHPVRLSELLAKPFSRRRFMAGIPALTAAGALASCSRPGHEADEHTTTRPGSDSADERSAAGVGSTHGGLTAWSARSGARLQGLL